MDYEPIPRARARRPVAAGADSPWSNYKQPITFQTKAAPVSVEFSPVAPHDFAVGSSLQVDVFSSQTSTLFRTLTRFKDLVRCASYRHDGKMIAAGDERGTTQLFDMASRAVVRTFGGHQRAVRVARFAGSGGRLFTASDDGRGLCWDVAAETQTCALEGHTDFVRCGAVSPASASVFATGSYDHSVKLWDVSAAASSRCIMTLRHADPVEDLCLLPGGGMLATASGTTLTIWDILSGGRVLHRVSSHSKTITSLSTDGGGAHVLSGSLDRMVKVYELSAGCKVVGSIKCDAPLLAMALSPTATHLVTGHTDNSVTVRRHRQTTAEVAVAAAAAAKRGRGEADADADAGAELAQPSSSSSAAGPAAADPLALSHHGVPGQVAAHAALHPAGQRPGTYRYFLRGRRHAAQPGDVVADVVSTAKLSTFDKALKRFRYHEAFNAALRDGSPEVVVSVVEELVQRNGLRIALQGRDQQTLQPVIAFLARQITSPPFAPTLIGLANLLLDMYAPVIGQSAAIDELFVKLRNTLEAEMKLQAELAQLLGAMDVLLAGAIVGPPTAAAPPPSKVPRLGAAAQPEAARGADGAAAEA